jgi:hypothetical protein
MLLDRKENHPTLTNSWERRVERYTLPKRIRYFGRRFFLSYIHDEIFCPIDIPIETRRFPLSATSFAVYGGETPIFERSLKPPRLKYPKS